ncbi:MAG: DUF1925 domain-containing protein [Deltaproteobacteria bacterium]|nr:DUF1925 domain-containing protein [Deltaproteobacteria bacterium]
MSADGGRPFLFVLHCHQPAGNLPSVLDEAYDRCYLPLLSTLARFEAVKVALHISGALLEHAALHRRAFIEAVADRVRAGQVELLGGGFYEPMLSVLPDADVAGQLTMMRACLDKHFGARPAGVWLTERVWEPDLPRVLAPAGARFTFLDAHHVQAVLPERGAADGYFVTEKAGQLLAVFPVDRGLRDRIPAAEPEGVVDYIAGAPGVGVLTFADDGEKLGLWPGSYPWVHEAGWLSRFFGALSAAGEAGRVRTVLPTAYLESAPARGRVYIPSGAYPELGRWALSPEARARFARVEAAVGPDELDRAHLRGGTWRDFLVRYPEAGWLHGRMLSVSERLGQALDEATAQAGGRPMPSAQQDRLASAQRELYRAQGADPYWRGWFGGVHLPFLRADAHRALVRAEALLDRAQQGEDPFVLFEERDLDLDGELEVSLANRTLAAHVAPHDGGAVRGLDDKVRGLQLVDVMARWPGDGAGEDGDDRTRAAFVDRFFAPEGSGPDLGDFASGRYRVVELAVDEDEDVQARLHLRREGWVGEAPVTVDKTYRVELEGGHLATAYRVLNRGAERLSAAFGPELSLSLSEQARVRSAEGWAPVIGARALAGELLIEDPQDGLRVVLDVSRPVRLEVSEVFTELETPAGQERLRQGLTLRLVVDLDLAPQEEAALTVALFLREAPR